MGGAERRGLSAAAAAATAGGRRHRLAVRSEILVRCEERGWTTAELAEDLEMTVGLASFHVAELRKLGLLREESRTQTASALTPTSAWRAREGWAAAFDELNRLAASSGA